MVYGKTIGEVLLKLLLYRTLPYKEVEKMFRTSNKVEYGEIPGQSIRNTLTRLKKSGLVSKNQNGWSSGKFAEKYLANQHRFPRLNYVLDKNKKAKMIIMYDIPESFRRERDWLRGELRILDFKQKQKSVWIGPAPLPKEFVAKLAEFKIIKYTSFFQVKEEDIV